MIKNQSKGGGVSVHLVGRDTSLDRKLELSDCHSQLQPLWSSEYDDATLRYLEGKGVLGPDGAEGAVQPDAAVAEEHKAYPATPWLTASSSADSAVGGSSSGAGIRVAQATSDASWYLAQPRMWVEGIDAVSGCSSTATPTSPRAHSFPYLGLTRAERHALCV